MAQQQQRVVQGKGRSVARKPSHSKGSE